MWSLIPASLAAAFLGSLYLLFGRNRKALRPPKGASMDRQAVPVKGQPGVYKCGYLTGEEDTMTYIYPEVRTLYDVFLRGMQKGANGPCLGSRKDGQPYEFLSYAEVFKKATDFGSALVGLLGLKAGNTTNLGIYARNCSDWFVSSLGAVSQSIVVVPLYDTLGADAAHFIVQQAEIEVIVVDNGAKANKLIESKSLIPTLKHVVVIDEGDVDEKLKQKGKEGGVSVHKFSEVLSAGAAKQVQPLRPETEDTYIICYTSGTTGTPKGVMLSHKNIVANLTAFQHGFNSFLPDVLHPGDSMISYLPLSHMMEQMGHWAILLNGASIGYFRGDIKGLTDDIKVLRPTIFPVVPRLLNRLYDGLTQKIQKSSIAVRTMYNIAYAGKLRLLKQGVVTRESVWDKLVFGKIQDMMGGRVRLMATGSAPISATVLETCRVAFGAVIVEAYGQTECTALATSTWPGEWEGGHCGGPAPCATVRLADVPELEYFAKDGKGEICIKGPSVSKGYYKDEEKTAEIFDEDGFLHTGDVGWMRPNGTIKIIDRKKHIFKLAQGEYVAPEKIEQIYTRAEAVQQVYVDGDSLERWLIAVVVPEFDVIEDWDRKTTGKKRTIKEICDDPKAAEYVLSQLQAIGKENKLNSIEQVKKVILEADPFSIENDLLTPTLKAKRPNLRKKYASAMTAVYKANPNL